MPRAQYTSFDREPRTICRPTDATLFTVPTTRSASLRFESWNRFFALLLDADAIVYTFVLCHHSNPNLLSYTTLFANDFYSESNDVTHCLQYNTISFLNASSLASKSGCDYTNIRVWNEFKHDHNIYPQIISLSNKQTCQVKMWKSNWWRHLLEFFTDFSRVLYSNM